VLAADGVTTRTSSLYGNQYGFTGRFEDKETKLWYFRARYYSGSLGRFVNRDPLGYVEGQNLYQAYFAPNGYDPQGLCDESKATQACPHCCYQGDGKYETIYSGKCSDRKGQDGFSMTFVRCGKCGEDDEDDEDRCGPDITDALTRLMQQIEINFNNRPFLDRSYFRSVGLHWNVAFADIHQLRPDLGIGCTTGNCPKGEKCQNTVTYRGQCFKTNELNYIIAGRILGILYGQGLFGRLLGDSFVGGRTLSNDPDMQINKWHSYTHGFYGARFRVWPTVGAASECKICDEKWNGNLTTDWPPHREDVPGVGDLTNWWLE
jgi:RHS repeat-associated protein